MSVLPPLVDDRPVSAAMSEALDAYQTATQDLFKPLMNPPRRGGPQSTTLPTSLLERLHGIDRHLHHLLDRAHEQAELQAKIDDALARIRAYDAKWRADARLAHKWKTTLEAAIREAAKDKERIRQTESAQLEPDAVLAYARRIANYTSVPPHARKQKVEGETIDWNAIWRLRGIQLPWPDDTKLTSGWLAETLLEKQADVLGDTQMVDTAPLVEQRDHRMAAPPSAQRPVAPLEDDEDDEFDIDLL